jgi:hypothetical protein
MTTSVRARNSSGERLFQSTQAMASAMAERATAR